MRHDVPATAKRCVNCQSLIWELGGDPVWTGYDHSLGKPGTVITSADETIEVPACLDCANTASIAQQITSQLDSTGLTDRVTLRRC